MVTAVLPSMTLEQGSSSRADASSNGLAHEPEANPTFEPLPQPSTTQTATAKPRTATSQIAGLVGMFTGCGALLALGAFLPLPARLQHDGRTPAEAVQQSYYIVGAIAIAVAILCFIGLANLAGEETKGWKSLMPGGRRSQETNKHPQHKPSSYSTLVLSSLKLGFTDVDIGLGYLGGFVARASSVGISLFIPLYVNAYFISSGLCSDTPGSSPHDIKESCKRAYTIAAALTGVSQLVALLCAPLFGTVDGRFRKFNAALVLAALSGVLGYILFPRVGNPDPKTGGGSVFAVVALLGISQIGAIVCSLSMLGRGIENGGKPTEDSQSRSDEDAEGANVGESAPLLQADANARRHVNKSRRHLKGSIAGMYSLAGGAGILLLTKLGGTLFDKLSPGAPFYMLAIFNGILLFVALACGVISETTRLSQR